MMNRYVTSLLLICLPGLTMLYGQIGISVGYPMMNQGDLNQVLDNGLDEKVSGISVSLDYWFRLKLKRVEFLPTIYFASFGDPYSIQKIGFQFKTTIYPFDLEGDCNCPTFSKENDLIKKGFFIRLVPGISNYSIQINHFAGFESIQDYNKWNPEIGLAIGLDFGVSNLLTISPELRYSWSFASDWTEAGVRLNNFSTLEAAIRFGLRFDKKNYGFKRRRRR